MKSVTIGVLVLLVWHGAVAAGTIVTASRAGARLNTDLMKGGGTDDTTVLQHLLDRASNGRPVHLIIDGPALVSGLDLYGNTTVECTAGGGLYLRNGSSRAILRNAHRSRGRIQDEHIEIKSCFLNGNRDGQPYAHLPWPDPIGYSQPSNREEDGTFITGLQFLGVNYLKVKDLTLWNVRAFGAWVSNANYVDIHNVTVDHGVAEGNDSEVYNTDGIHFTGPVRHAVIESVTLRTGDDGIGLNANDWPVDDVTIRNDLGPYVGQGPITDVAINNVEFIDALSGIRVFSAKERVDRISISNVVGVIKDALLVVTHWTNGGSLGNVGGIILSNISVARPIKWVEEGELSPADTEAVSQGGDGWRSPVIFINDRIESLSIRQWSVSIRDNRPLLEIAPEAHVHAMDVDVIAADPTLAAHILEIGRGAHIDQIRLALLWASQRSDEGRPPIVNRGGTIGRILWLATPPLYVRSDLQCADRLTVIFTQEVKALDFRTGVTIRVNGSSVVVDRILRGGPADTVDYILADPVRAGEEVTWAYNASEGSIQNSSGDSLPSTSEKVVTVRSREGALCRSDAVARPAELR